MKRNPGTRRQPLTAWSIAGLVTINLIWALSAVANKNALTAAGPFTVGALRFIPGALILLAAARARGPLQRIGPRHRWLVAYAGVIGIGGTYTLYNSGLRHTTASDGALLIACEPVFVALFAWALLRERLGVPQWLGLAAGVGGAALITGRVGGNQVILMAVVVECVSSVVGKRLTDRYNGLQVVMLEMLIGGFVFAALATTELRHGLPRFTPALVANLAFLAVLSSAFAYGVWYRILEHHPISQMAPWLLIQPFAGPFFGWLLRGERLRPAEIAGGALVIAGIALASLRAGGRAEDAPEEAAAACSA